jgi:hypothetical protein
VKRPGWLRGGDPPDPEQEGEDGEAPARRSGESERAQRERLAQARRERARKARADLAAKAREGKPEDGEKAAADRKRRRPEPATGAKRKPKGTAGKDAPANGETARKPEKAGKPEGARKPESLRSREPKSSRGGGDRSRGGTPSRRAGLTGGAVGAAKAARARATAAAPKAGRLLSRGLVAVFTIFFALVGFVLGLAIAAWLFARGPVRAGLHRLARLTEAASRLVTPKRVLAAVAAAGILLLALSQFADYRSISIGNDAYADGIQTVAPAPVTETDATGSAHSYLMIPLAVIALALLAASLTGRWRLCRLVALAGAIAIAVALLHDRPAGLDTGDRSVAYEGVKATLVGGFYAEIAAGLLIVVSSLLLGRQLRLEGASSSAPASRRSFTSRRLGLRRRTGVEGARA